MCMLWISLPKRTAGRLFVQASEEVSDHLLGLGSGDFVALGNQNSNFRDGTIAINVGRLSEPHSYVHSRLSLFPQKHQIVT